MRATLLTMAAVICAATGLIAQQQFELIATIVDPTGAQTSTVSPADVRVMENGVEAKILGVAPVKRVPKVQLLVDNGLGIPAASIGDLRNGVRGFLEAIPEGVEVTIVATAPQPRFLQRATTDRAELLGAVDRLTPDSGAGRFVESLHEATDRIRRDENKDAAYTIVSVGTMSGDVNVRDRDLRQTLERVQQFGTKVHVVLLSSVNRSASGGQVQTDLGQAVTQVSGGRFETIAAPNRLATLLPELGAEVAKSLGPGASQIRVTVERPAGAKGDLGQIQMGITGKELTSLTLAPAN